MGLSPMSLRQARPGAPVARLGCCLWLLALAVAQSLPEPSVAAEGASSPTTPEPRSHLRGAAAPGAAETAEAEAVQAAAGEDGPPLLTAAPEDGGPTAMTAAEDGGPMAMTAALEDVGGPGGATEQPADKKATSSSSVLEAAGPTAMVLLEDARAVCGGGGDTEACLAVIDMFLAQEPHTVGGPFRAGVKMLQTYGFLAPGGGGPCGSLCDMAATCLDGVCRFDPYDNAVAGIYLVRRGRLDEAQSILDALVRLLYPSGGQTLSLLRSAYTASGGVLDANIDTGNNAWVGMALTHFAAASGKACYAAIARAILHAIAAEVGCADHLGGFMGRMPRGRETWRATEHNIDMFALARMLGDVELQQQAGRFVAGMYGFQSEAPGAYATGTGGPNVCDSTPGGSGGAPIPADTQFWNLLAEADPAAERKRASLAFAMRDASEGGLITQDQDLIGDGALLTGVRFTSKGHGAQWENTASAVMGLGYYAARFQEDAAAGGGASSSMAETAARMQGSLTHQLAEYGAVLGSVLGGNVLAYRLGIQTALYPGGSDTGMGWAYFRYQHVAATAWTGLMLLQANPFAPPPQPVPVTSGVDAQCAAR